MRRIFMNISFVSVLLIALCTLNSCIFQGDFIVYDDLKALLDNKGAMENTTIVDVRAQSEWTAGFIPNAINIEYETFIDHFGMIKDGGTALASIVTNKENTLVIYGSGSDNARLFASKAIQLGYKDVKCYEGGMADWRDVHGDYLWITYEGFRQWYDTQCPFADGENYLVDVHPPSLYIDYGHIPGAINIMSKHFASLDPDSVTDIQDIITDNEAKIVFYCVGATWPAARVSARDAVSLGYNNIYAFIGGCQGWKEEGNALYQGEDEGSCAE